MFKLVDFEITTNRIDRVCNERNPKPMSYDAIRERLARRKEDQSALSANDKILLECLDQLTRLLESDLTQIKVALGHVARLLESRSD
jgi:hypothetical protein